MGREEQQEEREVLDSIFPEEITDISDTSYHVVIKLELPAAAGQDESEDDAPSMVLRVSYPDAYPDVAPDLDLSTEHNARKHPFLDVQADKTQLLEGLQPTIEENMGMAMIFTLVTTVKENAETLMAERSQAVVKEKEAEAAKAEEEENRKFQGTAVNKDSFVEWMAKFKQEMAAEEKRLQEEREAEDKKKRVAAKEKKLTGRELWERGLAQGGDEGESDEEEAVPTDGVSKLAV